MAKRLTEKQKDEMKNLFVNGEELDSLKNRFEVSKLTIIRNLKKSLGDNDYDTFLKKNKKSNKIKNLKIDVNNQKESNIKNNIPKITSDNTSSENTNKDFLIDQPLIEITPLIEDVNLEVQKDLSSIPINSMSFPKILYMAVDKNFELEIKILKDYIDWSFLPKDDLKRKTIEVFLDIKKAKTNCNKDQKVIKIPNTNVFKIVNKILLAKGISRIICGDKLISL